MQDTHSGKIIFIHGAMFCGKTVALRQAMHKYVRHNRDHSTTTVRRRCAVVKYKEDNRYSEDSVIDHDGSKIMAETISSSSLMSIIDNLSEYDVIGIDEGQFFPDLRDACIRLRMEGKYIYVAALTTKYDGNSWTSISELFGHCDEYIHVKGMCDYCDSHEGIYNHRISNESNDIMIGGAESYRLACHVCYKKTLSSLISM